jgi:hypothetical protein
MATSRRVSVYSRRPSLCGERLPRPDSANRPGSLPTGFRIRPSIVSSRCLQRELPLVIVARRPAFRCDEIELSRRWPHREVPEVSDGAWFEPQRDPAKPAAVQPVN